MTDIIIHHTIKWSEAHKWCTEKFGPMSRGGLDPDLQWTAIYQQYELYSPEYVYRFKFARPEDATLFALRWA